MQKVPFLRRSKHSTDGSRSTTTSPSLAHTRQFSTSSLSISSPTGFVDAEQVFGSGHFPKPQVATPTMTQSQRWKRLRRPLSIISTTSLTSLANSSESIRNNNNNSRRPSIPRKPVHSHSNYTATATPTPTHSNSSSLSTNEADFKSQVTTIASEDEVAKEHLRSVLASQFAASNPEPEPLSPAAVASLPPPLTAPPVIPRRSASRPKSQLFKVKRKSVHSSYGQGTANDLGTFIDLDNGSGLLDGIDTWISEGDAQFNNGLPSPTLGNDDDDDSFESDDSFDADFSRKDGTNEQSALTGSSYNLYTQFLKNELPHDSDEEDEHEQDHNEEQLLNSASLSTLDELDMGEEVPGLIMSDASEISLPTTPSVSTFEHYHSNGIVWIGDAKEEESVFDEYDNDQEFTTKRTQPKWLYRQDRHLFRNSKPPRLSLSFA